MKPPIKFPGLLRESVWVSVWDSVWEYVCLSVSQSGSLPACLLVSLGVCLSVGLPVSLGVCLPACLSACLPVSLGVCLSVWPQARLGCWEVFGRCLGGVWGYISYRKGLYNLYLLYYIIVFVSHHLLFKGL